MNLLFILDTLFYKHADFLMIVIDIVMFENFALCIVTYDFEKLLSLSPQLFVDFLHDFYINRVGRHLNVKLNLFDKFDKVDFLRGNNVTNVSVYYDILVINFKFFELYLTISLVNCVFFNYLKINAWISLLQIKILTTYHTLICVWFVQFYLPSDVILLFITVQLKYLILFSNL